MAYIIAEPCVDLKDGSCLDVCPVDCIYTTSEDNQLFIHPDECIDCAACEPVCPVSAIYSQDDVPQEWLAYVSSNKDYFQGKDDLQLEQLKDQTQEAPRNPNNQDIDSLTSHR